MSRPTCYRMVVLTSWARSMSVCDGTAPIVINHSIEPRMANEKGQIILRFSFAIGTMTSDMKW